MNDLLNELIQYGQARRENLLKQREETCAGGIEYTRLSGSLSEIGMFLNKFEQLKKSNP